MRILAADIGGTNARFGFFMIEPASQGVPTLMPIGTRHYACDDFMSFPDLMQGVKDDAQALGMESAFDVDLICIAAAGPIHNDACVLVNRPWTVRKHELHHMFGRAQTTLINDFVAQGYAALLHTQLGAREIHEGIAVPNSPLAVVGAGTGFGKAIVLPAPFTLVLPTEGGHAEFPFIGQEEYEYATFLHQRIKKNHLIGDHVVSGSGLEYLYEFHTGQKESAARIAELLPQYPQVLEWFARFHGRICRDFVLNTLALGGLIITGGIAAKIPVLEHPVFLTTFHDCAAHQALLEQIPIWHMLHQQAGVYGAALAGWHLTNVNL